MSIFLITVLILKLISSIYAFKNKLIIPGAFLASNLFFDLASQLFTHLYQPYPRPLVGVGFLFFAISVICYLANGVCLMFASAYSIKNLTLKQTAPLILISIAVLILCFYPAFIGMTLVNLFLAFYACIAAVCLVMISLNLFKEPSITKIIMIMLNLGCLAEILIVKLFGFQYYWLVNVSNCIFYLVILVVCALFPKYKNLLKL